MPASFVLISDQREARWLRAGAPSCMANLSVPFKQASHCLLGSKERSETDEGGVGRQGNNCSVLGSPTEVHFSTCPSALRRSRRKVLLLLVWEVWFQTKA